MPQGIAAKNHRPDPKHAAENIEEQIPRVGHFCRARDRRAEGADDGDKSGEDNRASAVFFVEIVCSLKMAAAKEKRVLAPVQRSSCRAAYPISNLVSDDRAKHGGKEQPFQGNNAAIGKDASGDEKGVARKKEAYKKTCFNENNGADERSAAGADQLSKSRGAK